MMSMKNGDTMNYSRLLVALIISISLSGCTNIMNRALDLGPLENRVEIEKDVMVPMNDGVGLASDIYHPVGVDKSPVIMIRTPYNKAPGDINGKIITYFGKLLSRHGYTVIIQDVRGRYNSGGDFYPFVNENTDGPVVAKWAAEQPWSNGNVGAWGGSYFGYTQWSLADKSPSLKAMVPIITCSDFRIVYYEGGALNYSNVLFWATTNYGRYGVPADEKMLKEGIANLPVIDTDDFVVGESIGFYDDAVNFEALEWLDKVSYEDRYKDVSAPMFSIAGWYDLFQKYQIEDMRNMQKLAKEPARSKSHIVVGPWGHGAFADSPVKFKDSGTIKMAQIKRTLDFYDEFLKGENTGADSWPAYIVYVMGDDEWKGFEEWPPKESKPVSYYLHSKGNANTRAGDGTLDTDSPENEPTDAFTYDPSDPVLTVGGPLLGPNLGPKDQEAAEVRDDVLVYTTAPLTEPLTVIGPISAVIYAKTDAKDTDFTAKLCDVHPNGLSVNINDGIIRARYRNGDLRNPELIDPEETYEYAIDLWHTAHTFKKGHQIRLQISSSNFPRFDRNLNTENLPGQGTEFKKANQAVFHDKARNSRLVLSVME
jgi:uncharacterized protein